MPAEFFIHPSEDDLLAGSVPLDGHAPVWLKPGSIEVHGSASIVLSHHQVKHGVVQRAVAGVAAAGSRSSITRCAAAASSPTLVSSPRMAAKTAFAAARKRWGMKSPPR